jgi:flagellar motor switch protein FliN
LSDNQAAVEASAEAAGTSSSAQAAEPESGGEGGADRVDFGLLRQVPMTVQVEVGRTEMTLGEILDELEIGSSIRLDRRAGDPVEVYVNGALFARAEVVVMQDQIGAKIVELIESPSDPRPSRLR